MITDRQFYLSGHDLVKDIIFLLIIFREIVWEFIAQNQTEPYGFSGDR